MWDNLTKDNFHAVVEAILLTAAAVSDDEDELLKPSNAVKLGFDIKRMLGIKTALSVLRDDEISCNESEKFRLVMETFWSTRIAKLARVILLERQFNKDVSLPHPEDLNKLNIFMEELKELDLTIRTQANFKKVASTSAAKLTMFNRRRPEEVLVCTSLLSTVRIMSCNLFPQTSNFSHIQVAVSVKTGVATHYLQTPDPITQECWFAPHS